MKINAREVKEKTGMPEMVEQANGRSKMLQVLASAYCLSPTAYYSPKARLL
jgi:hypothetical protein